MENYDVYPRELSAVERELLEWVLPEDRPGYRTYRDLLTLWKVISGGRRGEGNYILAAEGTPADKDSPLPQVFAFGAVETTEGEVCITVRERLGDQLEYEIALPEGKRAGHDFREIRRWTFSTWLPKERCPICSEHIREVCMTTQSGWQPVLAICPKDQRLWVYEDSSGVNHPIPVTNIYNELVMQRKVRDPKIALDSKRLFTDLSAYSDAELVKAFAAYNSIRTKIPLEDMILVEEHKKQSFLKRIFSRA